MGSHSQRAISFRSRLINSSMSVELALTLRCASSFAVALDRATGLCRNAGEAEAGLSKPGPPARESSELLRIRSGKARPRPRDCGAALRVTSNRQGVDRPLRRATWGSIEQETARSIFHAWTNETGLVGRILPSH